VHCQVQHTCKAAAGNYNRLLRPCGARRGHSGCKPGYADGSAASMGSRELGGCGYGVGWRPLVLTPVGHLETLSVSACRDVLCPHKHTPTQPQCCYSPHPPLALTVEPSWEGLVQPPAYMHALHVPSQSLQLCLSLCVAGCSLSLHPLATVSHLSSCPRLLHYATQLSPAGRAWCSPWRS
jgi:hypothetical protein